MMESPKNILTEDAAIRTVSCSSSLETLTPAENAIPIPPNRTSTRRTAFNPTFAAMLSANTMRDCNQVQAMMTQCSAMLHQAKEEVPFVCQTAEKYLIKCSQGQA